MSDLNHTRDQLQARLEAFYDRELVRTEIAELILSLDRRWWKFAFDWVVAIARADPEIGYHFIRQAGTALQSLGSDGCERWLQSALDAYYAQGQDAAISELQDLDQFITDQRKQARSLTFAEIRNVFSLFMQGLDGRQMNLLTDDDIMTDSETIRVPGVIDRHRERDDNFASFRACAIHQWAQCWYGTWRSDTIEKIPRKEPVLSTFHYLETLRLNACLARDLPGLARQMQALTPIPETWQPIASELQNPASTVLDSIRLSEDHWDKPRPARFEFQGRLDPDRVQATMEARIEREKQQLRLALARHAEEQLETTISSPVEEDPEIRRLMLSIEQDLGQVPEKYLVPATISEYRSYQREQDAVEADNNNGLLRSDVAPGSIFYDEWDMVRKAHRKRWCALRERDIEPDYDSEFVAETLKKYKGQVKSLCRSFEALREEYRIEKKQPDGDSLDFDALVDAIADTYQGIELSSRIYRKSRRIERDIAVVFMVDMSGSMKGWINLAQREALILLAEALQNLNDRYAIYGFSGNTRKRCELYRIKAFEQEYDLEVQARIAAIEPQHFTRMGVAIRHLSQKLEQIDARTRLLITLSDGRPYDYDHYDGDYAIEDTRMALYEARGTGIHPFCITIDEQARDYLPHMYGESSFTLIDDINKLPYRISEIYRSLTS